MREIVISVENLSKRYLVGHQSSQRERYATLRDVIARELSNFTRKTADFFYGRQIVQGDELEEIWALKDVSFELKQGDVLGIIGRNGAGKSTLLKILSRITEPTKGRVRLRGRVASLLEVGTGFHPELTGRENIFLNGAILGMRRAEIRQRFDEIVAFARVERFLDTPVKRYSSGMYLRLAFSVAAHLESEILFVDEVLAVGDLEFQEKCLRKVRSVAQSEGRTVLFVSHNMAAIQTLCNQALLLDAGSVYGLGEVNQLITAYSTLARPGHAGHFQQRQLSETLTLDYLRFTPDCFESGSPIEFFVQLSCKELVTLKELAILIYSGVGTRVAILDLRTKNAQVISANSSLKLRGRVDTLPLVEGDYFVGLFLYCGDFLNDLYDLATISVRGKMSLTGFPPYPPNYRGLLELSYQFSYDA